MSAATTSPPTSAPHTRDRDTGHLHHSQPESKRPWTWVLAESLAYAGAAFDPAAALAAQRLARIRDRELHSGG